MGAYTGKEELFQSELEKNEGCMYQMVIILFSAQQPNLG